MKKNVLARYKAAIIYGIFGLFIGINVLIVAAHAHAAPADMFSMLTIATNGDTPTLPPAETPALTPIETPTLMPTDTPIPVPTNTPTPVPTKAPAATPTAQPTQKPVPTATPTAQIPGLPPSNSGNVFPGVTPVPSPTAKATPTVTATPTMSVETTPAASPSTSTPNISDQGKQEGSGISTTIVPVAIGSVLLLLIGGLTCFMFLRKPDTKQLAYARTPWRQTGGPAWSHSQVSNAPFTTPAPGLEPQAAFAATSIPDVIPMSPIFPAIPMPTTPHKAITPTPPPSFATGPQPTITMPTGPQQALFPTTPPPFAGKPQATNTSTPGNANKAYTPSDLKPITTALPRQVPGPTQKNPISTSDMSPLLLDNFDLSGILPQDKDNQADYKTIPAQINTPPAFSPLLAPTIQDDPVLETIMRQAQMGLYALPNPESIDPEEIS